MHTLITNTHELRAYCDEAKGASPLCVDTEFIREDSYLPRLELIQINADGKIALIDYPALEDASPLWDLLYAPDTAKVFHAADQDLALLYQESGRKLTGVFDTQIAAAFVGWGEQIGYGQLVKLVTGKGLAKAHSYSAWSARPLEEAQLEYAADDVRFLPRLAEALQTRLEELGRLEWVAEEFRAMEDAAASGPTPPELLYQRVRGADSLDRKDLAILRELAIWRDDEAQYLNRIPVRVVRDEVLISLARHRPQGLQELKNTRGLRISGGEQEARRILSAIQRGLAADPETWPQRPEYRQTTPARQAVVHLLQTFIRLRSLESQIAWGLLASGSELELLASGEYGGGKDGLRVLEGWRYDLVGEDLLRLMRGELALTVGADDSRLRSVETNGAEG